MNETAVFGALAFFASWLGLLVFPPLALSMQKRELRCGEGVRWRPYTVAFLLWAGFVALGFRTQIYFCNVLFALMAYFCYCKLASISLLIKNAVGRRMASVVVGIPVAMGYVLATVGFLGLGFIATDYATPPAEVRTMSEDIVCKLSYWGMAASESGYKVALFRRFSLFPVLEREVLSVSVSYFAQNTSDVDCATLYARFKG